MGDKFSAEQVYAIDVSNDGTTVKCTAGSNYTAYGSSAIDSIQNIQNTQQNTWKIKVDKKAREDAWIGIGLQASHQDKSHTCWFQEDVIGYCYLSDGRFYRNGHQEKDVIGPTLVLTM